MDADTASTLFTVVFLLLMAGAALWLNRPGAAENLQNTFTRTEHHQ